jgi:hypothetical protein
MRLCVHAKCITLILMKYRIRLMCKPNMCITLILMKYRLRLMCEPNKCITLILMKYGLRLLCESKKRSRLIVMKYGLRLLCKSKGNSTAARNTIYNTRNVVYPQAWPWSHTGLFEGDAFNIDARTHRLYKGAPFLTCHLGASSASCMCTHVHCTI